ncbi:13979_t:CDS:2, partial [Acaulospora morrowiae]
RVSKKNEKEERLITKYNEKVTVFINSVIGSMIVFPGCFRNSYSIKKTWDTKLLPSDSSNADAFKCHLGLIISKRGLIKTHKEYINFYTMPKIQYVNLNRNLEIELSTTNSILYSYFLNNGIAISKDQAHELFESVRFIIPDIRSPNFDINADAFQAMHFNISIPLVEISFDSISPSDELIQTLESAVQNTNPYLLLCKAFEKFGDLIPCKIIIGKKLTRNCQEFSLMQYDNVDQFMEIPLKKVTDENNSEFQDVLNEWKTLLFRYGFDSTYLIGNEECVKIEHIEEWMSKEDLQLEIIKYLDLKPTYKIFNHSMCKKIEKCFMKENQVLMTGYIKIDSINICNYYVEFDTPLQSDNYQIFGLITNNNSKISKNSIVKFESLTKHGFVAIFKSFDDKKVCDYNVSWMMIGIPRVVGFYSIHTRDLAILYEREVNINISSEVKEYEIRLYFSSLLRSIYFLSTRIEFPKDSNAPFIETQYLEETRVVKLINKDEDINKKVDNFVFHYIFYSFPSYQDWIIPDLIMLSNKKYSPEKSNLWEFSFQNPYRLYGKNLGHTIPQT